MPQATYKKEECLSVNGYGDENGLKLLTSKLDSNYWNRMAMIWSHMHDIYLLRQDLQLRLLVELIQYDKKNMSEIVAFQKDKVRHLK